MRKMCCPFARRIYADKISCDAGLLRLGSKRSRRRWCDMYCCDEKGWVKCPMAAAMYEE